MVCQFYVEHGLFKYNMHIIYYRSCIVSFINKYYTLYKEHAMM